MNMVEKVARAICKEQQGDPGYDVWTLSLGSPHRALYLAQARAAIAAMREPSEAMLAAGRWPAEDDGALACWQAMIDDALAEGGE